MSVQMVIELREKQGAQPVLPTAVRLTVGYRSSNVWCRFSEYGAGKPGGMKCLTGK